MRSALTKTLSIMGMALVCLGWQPAQAAWVTENFNVEITDGPGAGETGTLEVRYEDSGLTGFGDETLGPPDVEVELDVLGQIFDETNDVDFPGFPQLGFVDGVIAFLDLLIEEGSTSNPTDIIFPDVQVISGRDISGDVWFASTMVPLPASAWLLGSALAGLGALKRRKR